MKRNTARLRIVVGQVFLLVSIMLTAITLDFVPDREAELMQGRARLCEAMAINCSAHAGHENWDALEECLRDLSWLESRRVIIVHEDLPPLSKDELTVYADVLRSCIRHWKPEDDHELVAVFPEAARKALQR